MKFENGTLSVGFFDVLRVVFFPITLLVWPSVYFYRKFQECPYNHEFFWGMAQVFYVVGIVATGVFFSISTLTYHRDIVAVETVEHMETVAGQPEAVTDVIFVTLEERPKLFNTDQIKTWHFCRSGSQNPKGEWFLVEDDGTLVPCPDEGSTCWERDRVRYLESMWDRYNEKLNSAERYKELTEKVRLNNPW